MQILLISGAACLYALAFPKPGAWWLAFFCLIPFFAALERSTTLRRLIFFAVFWGLCHSLTMGYWLFTALMAHYDLGPGVAAAFFGVCVWAPLCLVFFIHAAAYRLMMRDRLLFYAAVAPALWVLTEYAKARLLFLVPWGDLGYSLMPFGRFVQSADLFGIYGISFLVVMCNSVLFFAFKGIDFRAFAAGIKAGGLFPGRSDLPRLAAAAVVLVAGIGLPMIYGQYRIVEVQNTIESRFSEGDGFGAAIVQGNYRHSDRWSGMGFEQRLMTYLSMSETREGSDTRVIVWPETVLNAAGELDSAFFASLQRWLGNRTLLIAGGVFAESRNKTPRIYNSAFFVSGRGRLARYDKHILLPYAETGPNAGLPARYYAAPESFAPGRTRVVMSAQEADFGASICVEILYTGFIQKSVSHGAEILVNLSNNAWFGDSPMPYIHLYAVRMRAVENRRFLMLAANSGISSIIGPTGRVAMQTDLFSRQRIDGRVLPMRDQTLYTRWGLWIVYVSGGICAAAILMTGISGSARYRKQRLL